MYIEDSRVGCGVKELYDVGGFYADVPSQARFDTLMRGHDGVVIASLTKEQYRGTEFLIANGFKKAGRYKVNPNSGNKIALFVYHGKKKAAKKPAKKKR